MMKKFYILMALAMASTVCAAVSPIRVSADCRNFVTAEGKPFFYLADTGWTIVTRLTLDEVDEYLADRKAKGFNVIQLVLVPWQARETGNRAGIRPYLDDDMARPNPAYFDHVEAVLDRIEASNIYPAVVPFWLAGAPEPTPEIAKKYAEYAAYLGSRFGKREIFWVLGADRAADPFVPIIRDFAAELARSSGRTDLLMTHHPQGGQSSSRWFHDAPWLDFNMAQSGHNLDLPHYRLIDGDYVRNPTKPVIDGESAYEHLVNNLGAYKPGARLVTDSDVRRQSYQNVFAGAAGVAYGCCEIYEFFREGDGKAQWTVGMPWREAMQLPGSTQVGYLASLFTSADKQDRQPDQRVIASANPNEVEKHIKAIRDRSGRWAYIYLPQGGEVTVKLALLKRKAMVARWFDPRTGKAGTPFKVAAGQEVVFTAPTAGAHEDWVLQIEEAKQAPEP